MAPLERNTKRDEAGGEHAAAGGRHVSQRDLAGDFAFRFSGFTVLDSTTFRLAGLGLFRVDEAGNVSGTQKSSYTALQGAGAQLQTGAFTLKGRVTVRADGSGHATLRFTNTSGHGLGTDAEFHVMVAESTDRIWMISSKGKVSDTGEEADELVDVEAVRVDGRTARR